jgi:hypothetical protein
LDDPGIQLSLRISGMAFVVVVLAATLVASAQTVAAPMWGAMTAGLRIGISIGFAEGQSNRARLTISLNNVSENDWVVNLGTMLANGKVMFPDAVRLTVVDPKGVSRELHFFNRRYPGVAGRVDDFIVALRSGATYTFTTWTDQYWSPSTKEIPLKWISGVHRISARFEGRGASHLNSGMTGVRLLNFWIGSVSSGAVSFAAR